MTKLKIVIRNMTFFLKKKKIIIIIIRVGEKKSQTELEFNKSEVIFGPH